MADDELYVVPGRWLKDMERVRRKVDNMTLGGRVEFSNTPTSISGYVRPSPPQPTVRPSAEVVIVRIAAQRPGGGKYTGFIVQGPITVPASTANLTMPEGMTDGEEVEIWNLAENALSTRALSTSTRNYYIGIRTSATASDGKPIVIIHGFYAYLCT